MRKSGRLIHPTEINPKYILLSEKSQTQKTTCCIIHSWKRPSWRGGEQFSGCQGLEVGRGVNHQEQNEGIFQSNRTVLYLDYIILSIYQNSQNCTQKEMHDAYKSMKKKILSQWAEDVNRLFHKKSSCFIYT